MPAPLTPMTYSASRISTWMACPTKAGWQYICGYREPSSPSQEFGVVVHGILEQVKRDGILPDLTTPEGAVAAEALPYVADLSVATGARIEGEFFLQGRHRWTGFKDITAPGDVRDYKTTSDFRWAKTPDSLLVDPQAVLYAHHEFQTWEGPDVKLTWLYLRKRAPYKVLPVTALMSRAHAARAFAALETFADEMHAAADAAPLDIVERHAYVQEHLPKNTDHCNAFGGCPHRSRCNIPMFAEPKGPAPVSDLLSRLTAMTDTVAAGGNPLASGAASPTMRGMPSPLVAPTATTPLAFAPGGAFHGLEAPPAPVVQSDASGTTTFNPNFLLQPDAPASPASPASPGDASPTERMAAIVVPTPLASAAPLEVEPNQINPPKRGRGRPRKEAAPVGLPAVEVAGGFTAPIAPAVPAPALFVAPAPAPGPAPAPIAPSGHRISTFYVGCVPHGGGAESDLVDFDLMVAKAKVTIGPAAYYGGYGFKANGMLLNMLELIVQSDKPVAVVMHYPASPEATLALSMLRSVSDTVVEATSR